MTVSSPFPSAGLPRSELLPSSSRLPAAKTGAEPRGTAKCPLSLKCPLMPPLPCPPFLCSTNIKGNQAKTLPRPGRSWQRLSTGPDPAMNRSKVLQGWGPRRPMSPPTSTPFPAQERKATERVAGSPRFPDYQRDRPPGRRRAKQRPVPQLHELISAGLEGKLRVGGDPRPSRTVLAGDIPRVFAHSESPLLRALPTLRGEPEGLSGSGFLPLTCFAAAPASPTPDPSSTAEPERERRPVLPASLFPANPKVKLKALLSLASSCA